MIDFGKDNKFVLFLLVLALIFYAGPKHVISKTRRSPWVGWPMLVGAALLALVGITVYQLNHTPAPQPARVEHNI
jgi:hypothetical protein